LQSMVLISSGGLTNRIDRLEKAGLVTRHPDPADRRGVIVRLTNKGVEVADDATEHHLGAEAELLNPLDTEERQQLAALLRKLLSRHES